MIKTFAKIGASAAALAVSAAFATPTAVAERQAHSQSARVITVQYQDNQYRGRDDQVLFGGRDDRHDNRGWGKDRRGGWGRPTQDGAVDVCYRAMNRELGGRNFWSIQYDGEPRLREERHGFELRGRVRLHGPRGFSHLETVCELDGNRVVRFYVDR